MQCQCLPVQPGHSGIVRSQIILTELEISPHSCDSNSDGWCVVNENLSFSFILQQKETRTMLIIFHEHDILETVPSRNQFLRYSRAFHYAKPASLQRCPEMKTCWGDWRAFTKTVNMHFKDIKELTWQSLSSGSRACAASHVKMKHLTKRWQYEEHRWNCGALRETSNLLSVFVFQLLYCWLFDLQCNVKMSECMIQIINMRKHYP